MTIQKKLEFDGQEIWVTECVSPQELYDLIDRCESVRMCLCERCKHYTAGAVCMKHPSVCITEDFYNEKGRTDSISEREHAY